MNRLFPSLPPSIALFLRLSRPFFLLGGVLLYALGAGIARYLGVSIDLTTYWLGQGCVTMLQLSTHYLNEYFDVIVDRDNPNRTPFSGGSGVEGLPRQTPLLAAATTLTVGAVLTVLLYVRGDLGGSALIILAVAFLCSIFYSVPPLRLVSSGYGELTTSILVANLVPAFAYLLQDPEMHRLLAMTTFPLTCLHLSMLLAFSLPDYATDVKYDKKTLLVRIGWQRGMLLHNILVLAAYVFMLAAVFRGMPWRLAWPGLLTLPLGIFQVWQMNLIAQGGKPRWVALTFSAVALFGLTAYFITLAYWTG